MKKFVCILMIVCCVCCLYACVTSQPNNYAELEERISRLEKQFGIQYEPTTKPIETSTITDFVEPLPSNSTEPLSTNCVNSCVYDLSEMTPENIVETIKYYIDSRPQNGDTYESVKNRLKVEPVYYREPNLQAYGYNYIKASFVDENKDNCTHDYIDNILYSEFKLGMNGVTLENCNIIDFIINFNIVDYSRAEKVFDKIANYLNSNTNNNIEIRKNGGEWHISYSSYSHMNSNSIFMSFIDGEMLRTANSYSFSIHIKINDTNQE